MNTVTKQAVERPILFSGEMVKAILDGRKTQTRRVVKLRDGEDVGSIDRYRIATTGDNGRVTDCPYGKPGDRLWVRESHAPRYFDDFTAAYKADWTSGAAEYVNEPTWKPSIHMFRKDSRINLEITNVRVERLNEISWKDAKAEGVEPSLSAGFDFDIDGMLWDSGCKKYVDEYKRLWDKINGKKHPWSSNPWVWVVEFKKLP